MHLTRRSLLPLLLLSLLLAWGHAPLGPEASSQAQARGQAQAVARVEETLVVELPAAVDRCWLLAKEGDLLEVSWEGGSVAVAGAGIRRLRSNTRVIVKDRVALELPFSMDAPRIDVRGVLAAPSVTLRARGWLEVAAGGRLEAERAGKIRLEADVLSLVGPVSCPEGTVDVEARNVLHAGPVELSGAEGGVFSLFCERYVGTVAGVVEACGSTGSGGSVEVQADVRAFSSGSFLATGQRGGRVRFSARDTRLVGALLDASGVEAAGEVEVGTQAPGVESDERWAAETLALASSSRFRANATLGSGGRIVIGSRATTIFQGQVEVQGGAGRGGFVEVSSSGDLSYEGQVEAAGSEGAGELLLDPQNLVIDDATGRLAQYEFVDPNPDGSWASSLIVLSGTSQNVVIGDSGDDLGGSNAGAAYLFDSTTGALLATLTGASANDAVGVTLRALSNGNYVVGASNWDDGATGDVGAVTFGPAAGVSGAVSGANSLVGVTANDRVGNNAIVALTGNGNYVVCSSGFNAGGNVDAGAATWCNGATGTVGPVTLGNSLVGATANDDVGLSGAVALTNGNYIVRSPNWNNGGASNAGAATWGNGATGATGVVSTANSIVGSTTGDTVSGGGVTALGNGHCLILSGNWNNGGAAARAGAVTWANGTLASPVGPVTAANSIVGSTANDLIGATDPVVLTNNNFVVPARNWDNGGTVNVGAFTWGNGATGTAGTVGAGISLIGAQGSDGNNSGALALTNGNYVVRWPMWDNATAGDAGAVVFGNGTTGVSGTVGTGNSLHGTTNSDFVGIAVTALTNGNYVATSSLWDNGGLGNAGHATWVNGTTGLVGAVSAANSLVGPQAGDGVGLKAVALTNGNYVVTSANWSNGALNNAGAATWCDGSTGRTGAVTTANSLVGTAAADLVGNGGVGALSNGNYVVRSPDWKNGSVAVGAATWGNGATGLVGTVSTTNSLYGSTASDKVSDNLSGNGSFLALTNGNYVVFSPNWDNGGTADAGAFTWCSGTGPTAGAISNANSLVGTTASDQVGSQGGTQLTDGNFVVRSASWDNGATVNAGALTFADGSRASSGDVSVKNSLTSTGGGMLPAPQTLSVGFVGQFQGTAAAVGYPVEQTTYTRGRGQTVTVTTERLVALLSAGVDVTLQASQDITVRSAITADNPAGDAGILRLQAGRSVNINANISLDRSTLFEAQANVGTASGTVDADRGAGDARVNNTATVSVAEISGTSGTAGTIRFTTNPGTGLTNNARADYVGGSVTAGTVNFLPFSNSMSPTSAEGSTDVVLTGGGFDNAGQETPQVTVGGVKAALQSFNSATITFRIATGTPGGSQQVRVTTAAGTAIAGNLNVTGAGTSASGGGGALPGAGGATVVTKLPGKGCSLGDSAPAPLPWLLLGLVGVVVWLRRLR